MGQLPVVGKEAMTAEPMLQLGLSYHYFNSNTDPALMAHPVQNTKLMFSDISRSNVREKEKENHQLAQYYARVGNVRHI